MERSTRPLMERIEIQDFLSLSPDKQREIIEALQAKRTNSIERARTKMVGTKSARKRKAARTGRKPADPTKQLKAAIAKMKPHEIEALKAAYGMK